MIARFAILTRDAGNYVSKYVAAWHSNGLYFPPGVATNRGLIRRVQRIAIER
jgi:hypothetical protein